jgi:hypothetical protein
VLGVAIIGSVAASQFRHHLRQTVGTLRLAPSTRAAIAHAGAGTGLRVPIPTPDATQADRILAGAFTAAGHSGWYLATAAGAAIAMIAYGTMSARAKAVASNVMAE